MKHKSRRRKVFENIHVIDAGAKGKSIGKAPEGQVIFIDNAVPGDVAHIQTYKKRKGYFHGKAIEFVALSDKRTEPVCQHFGVCGGCKWQDMGYEHQLFYKQKEVAENLRRIGKVELPEITPIKGSEEKFFYRNKMEFSFSDSRWITEEEKEEDKQITDRNALGFHIPGMWDKILDLEKCHLQRSEERRVGKEC
jgi:23S rRNA (uracil1939-C5)-methyltransferase